MEHGMLTIDFLCYEQMAIGHFVVPAGTVPDLRAALSVLVEQVVLDLLADEACFVAELAVEVACLALATAKEVLPRNCGF